MERFSETEQEGVLRRKSMRLSEKEIRDFVPYKVAKRIQAFIEFSVKLSGQAPDLKLDDDSIKYLELIDKEF
jgi:hypothetical protein